MPIQQISVVPVRETASDGKSTPHSKDKNEGRKAPGRSGSRSSNISKASNSTAGLGRASRTSSDPSAQDICSSGQLTRLDEDVFDSPKHLEHTHTAVMTLGSSAQTQKKQVKRRRRRKRDICTAFDCVDANANRGQTDHSERSHGSDRSERGERRERAPKSRRELAPRLRGSAPSDSTSEEEGWRQARSWSKEKARRGGCRGERDGVNGVKGGEGKEEVMELQSVDSDDGKEENQALPENGGGPKKRRGGTGSPKREGSQGRDTEKSCGGYKSRSSRGSSSLAEEGEEPVTKRYQEEGSGGEDMAAPTPQTHCGVNGGTAHFYSEDSEQEVCRICHCEGDEECPLIMPCRCTGSLRFVHQACLNQWIKSSDTRCCELCKFDFIMETQLKPLRKWEELQMSKSERRKIFCSVLFHLIAIGCVLSSVYVLVKRTAEEIRLGRDDELWRVALTKYYTPEGVVEWPFWTKLIVVAIGFTGGLIFMYIQCKVYLQLWRRLKAFNRIITVQNCPEKGLCPPQTRPAALTNGKHQTTEVPQSSTPATLPACSQTDSDQSVEAAVAPALNPV